MYLIIVIIVTKMKPMQYIIVINLILQKYYSDAEERTVTVIQIERTVTVIQIETVTVIQIERTVTVIQIETVTVIQIETVTVKQIE